jgi:hypothetical protein
MTGSEGVRAQEDHWISEVINRLQKLFHSLVKTEDMI